MEDYLEFRYSPFKIKIPSLYLGLMKVHNTVNV